MYDLIGDIHGHLKPLKRLLHELGYLDNGDFYEHPGRQAFFVGDFIDRGPDSRGVVALVRSMVENGAARAVMGNHEWNAIQFHSRNGNGEPLRPHSAKNVEQHRATLESYGDDKKLKDDIRWFKSLPLYHDKDGLRVVHATWREDLTRALGKSFPDGVVDDSFFVEATRKGSAAFEISETLLKGQEANLPAGVEFKDKDGNVRRSARLRWWRTGQEASPAEHLFVPADWNACELDESFIDSIPFYPSDAPPVFFGHYWKTGPMNPETGNVCCLDYSVARGGQLVAYRWDGESTLDGSRMHSVPAM